MNRKLCEKANCEYLGKGNSKDICLDTNSPISQVTSCGIVEDYLKFISKLKTYKVRAKNIEYLLCQYIEANNIDEAKDIFRQIFEEGNVGVAESQIQFQEVQVISKLCRYCKNMKDTGAGEGSMHCPKSKGDDTAKMCQEFKYFLIG